ncbi:MAG: hypothetical protein WKF70_05890, partial [Chitinophagaceae bacterium]
MNVSVMNIDSLNMNKIYLILRNNQHEGPYSVSEMMSLSVKKQDFIKVQGSKKGWQYAADIQELSHLTLEDTSETATDSDYVVKEAANAPEEGMVTPAEVLKATGEFKDESPIFLKLPGVDSVEPIAENQKIPDIFAGSTYIISNEKYELLDNEPLFDSNFLPPPALTAITSPNATISVADVPSNDAENNDQYPITAQNSEQHAAQEAEFIINEPQL